MDTRTRLREATGSWGLPAELSIEQADADLTRARTDLESALQGMGMALLRDAQVRASAAVTDVKRRMGDAELRLELLVSRIPAVGPQVAMELYGRMHPTTADPDGADAWPTRPSNLVDTEDTAMEGASAQLDYLECIGVHVA